MKQYTNYCTQEQTLRAHKLGAPLESGIARGGHWDGEERPFIYREPEPDCIAWNNSSCWFCPTTQQMIGWLREKGVLISVYGLNPSFVGCNVSYHGELEKYDLPTQVKRISIGEPNTTELAAIDAALDYLEKGE